MSTTLALHIELVDESDLELSGPLVPVGWEHGACDVCNGDVMAGLGSEGTIMPHDDGACSRCGTIHSWVEWNDHDAMATLDQSDGIRVLRRIWEDGGKDELREHFKGRELLIEEGAELRVLT